MSPRRPRRRGRSFVALLGAGLSFLHAGPSARADLRGDAERLAAGWAQEGQRITRGASQFVEHGRVKLLSLEPNGALAAFSAFPAGCTTIALIGVRTADFFVDPERSLLLPRGDARAEGDDDRRARSAAGVVELGRCGAEQADLRRLAIEVASSRAAIEVVMAQGQRGPRHVPEVLFERAAGPLAPRGDPGAAIEPGPIATRIAHATARATAEGAAKVTRAGMRASDAGVGQFQVRLAAGCHRLEVFAEVPSRLPHRATDVDAEARDTETGKILARDRADVPDARLDLCVGDVTRVDVPFVGAAGAVEVALTDAHFPIPARVPVTFGKRARGGFAGALHRRHAPDPRDEPMALSLGVQGVTEVPLEVEPGHCYLAAVAVTKGDARSLRLAADLDGRNAHDEAADRSDGAAVAFCAETSRRTRLEVDVRGNAPSWVLVVWPMGESPP